MLPSYLTVLYAFSLLLLPLVSPLPIPRPESLVHLVESLVDGHAHQHFVQGDDPGLHHRRDNTFDPFAHPFAPWGDSTEGAPFLPRAQAAEKVEVHQRDDLEAGEGSWQPWIGSDNPDVWRRDGNDLSYPQDVPPILPRDDDRKRIIYRRRAPRPDQLITKEKSWQPSIGSDNPDAHRRRNDGVDATQAPPILPRNNGDDFAAHSPSPVLIHNPQSDGTANGDEDNDSEANLKCQPGGPKHNAKFATGLLRPTLATIVKPHQPFLVMYCTPTYHAMRSMGWDVLAYNSNSSGMGRILATGVKGESTHVTVDDPYYDRLAVFERQNGVAGDMFAMATRNLVFDHGDGDGSKGQGDDGPKVTKQGITLAGVDAHGTSKDTASSTLDELSNNQHSQADALDVQKSKQDASEKAAGEEHAKRAMEQQVVHDQGPPSALKVTKEAEHEATAAEQHAADVAEEDVVSAEKSS